MCTASTASAAEAASAGPISLQLHGAIQFDWRDQRNGPTGADDSLVRRARPTLEVGIGERVSLRLTPELASDPPRWVDAWIDVQLGAAHTLRAGRMKSPIGFERLVSSTALPLVERGFPSELAPNREVGVLLLGERREHGLSYSFGVVNGATDGRNAPSHDEDDAVELQGRLARELPLPGGVGSYGAGIAAGHGDARGSSALPRYRSPGQRTFFSYASVVEAAGSRTRVAPHAWFWRGPFGAIAEWSQTRQVVEAIGSPDARRALRHRAWQLTGIWVLSGEDAGFKGIDAPARALGEGGWGAWQLAARIGELDIDDDAFLVFADPSHSASRARSRGIALSWKPNRHVRWMLDWQQTGFDGGAAAGDRDDERLWLMRLQFAF